ncbi:MAG TPA: PF20097 family protein [Oscillospiraceae bacterium]|nr:PF20097 family protein [Oscillospiraceae bacterium]
MKCPNCDKEIEEEFLQANGSSLIWSKNTHSAAMLANPQKGEVQVAHSLLEVSILAFRCDSCRIIAAKY